MAPVMAGDVKLSLGCVIVAVIWQFIGNYVLIYYTSLHDVSEEVMESARLDGSEWNSDVFHIQLPLVWPTVRLTLVLATVNSLKYFDLCLHYDRRRAKFIQRGTGDVYYQKCILAP